MFKIHLKYLLIILLSINSLKAMEVGEAASSLEFDGLSKDIKFQILDDALKIYLVYPPCNFLEYIEKRLRNLKRVNKEFYIFVKKIFSKSPLAVFIACNKGNIDFVQNWLRQVDFINIRDRNDETLLMAAIIGKNENLIQLLLENGIDVNAKCNDGQTALVFACHCKNIEDIPYSKAIINSLIDHGANVNAKDKVGWDALMVSAFGSQAKIVKLLLKKGANVKAKSRTGLTALRLANESHNYEAYFILKKR